jgi:hypothetical protein
MPRLELNLPYTEEGEALASAIEQQFPGVRRVDLPNQPGMLADRARQSYPTPPPVPAGAQPQDWRTNRRGVPSNPRGSQNLPSVVGPDGQRHQRGGRIPGVTLPEGVTRRRGRPVFQSQNEPVSLPRFDETLGQQQRERLIRGGLQDHFGRRPIDKAYPRIR